MQNQPENGSKEESVITVNIKNWFIPFMLPSHRITKAG